MEAGIYGMSLFGHLFCLASLIVMLGDAPESGKHENIIRNA